MVWLAWEIVLAQTRKWKQWIGGVKLRSTCWKCTLICIFFWINFWKFAFKQIWPWCMSTAPFIKLFFSCCPQFYHLVGSNKRHPNRTDASLSLFTLRQIDFTVSSTPWLRTRKSPQILCKRLEWLKPAISVLGLILYNFVLQIIAEIPWNIMILFYVLIAHLLVAAVSSSCSLLFSKLDTLVFCHLMAPPS